MLYDWFNFLKKLTLRKIVNYLILRTSLFISLLLRRPVVFGYPAVATIEPTNRCNLKCAECPAGIGSMNRPRGNLDLSLFRALIDELSPGLSFLMLYFQGEPFLHPQLEELIVFATSKKIYTSVSTNGHYLSSRNAKKLILSGLDRIIISLDGTDQESYSRYRKGGDFNEVLHGIVNLVRIKKEMHSRLPMIILQFLVMRHNEHQVDEVKTLGKRLGVNRTVIKSLQVYDFVNNLDLLPSDSRYSRYTVNKNGEVIIKNRLRNRCRRLWHTIVILQDGSVVPCCFDKDARFILGKYPERSLYDIWNGNEAVQFRQKILNARKNIKMCCNCTEGSIKTYIR